MRGVILSAAVCAVLPCVSAAADMRGQAVCDIPPTAAVIVTLKLKEFDEWLAWKPTGRDLNRWETEAGSLGGWVAEYICDVEIDYGSFPGLDVRTARLHRVNRDMTHLDTDPHRIIRGEAEPKEETQFTYLFCRNVIADDSPWTVVESQIVEYAFSGSREAVNARLEEWAAAEFKAILGIGRDPVCRTHISLQQMTENDSHGPGPWEEYGYGYRLLEIRTPPAGF